MSGMPSASLITELRAKYGLRYHVNYAFQAQELIGLRGKRVFEVGGSLPREFVLNDLGAAQWVALENREYWGEVLSTGNVTGTPPQGAQPPVAAGMADPYRVLFGTIDHLADSLQASFDVVFSIAAFEHIARLPEALEQMYKLLIPGGKLFSLFAPVWSSFCGHHLPDITDKDGTLWGVNNCPIPLWGHLLSRPMELFDLLQKKCDAATAREIVYFVYGSPHINRFYLEDYLEIVARSPFTVKVMTPQWQAAVPEDVRAQLVQRHPAGADFASQGLLLILERE